MNKPLTDKEKKAWNYAENKHKSQIRKFINQSYFDAHVSKVNGIVKMYTKDEDILCASLLHDVLEDCFDDIEIGYLILKDEFGEHVANLVMELTSIDEDIIYYGGKKEYLTLKMIHMSDDALIIKLADRLQNISDAFTASDKFRYKYYKQTIYIINGLKDNRRLNRIQVLIVGEIMNKIRNIKSMFKY